MPFATVYPGTLKALDGLHLDRDALQSAYEWAMRTMFKAPYESAQLEFDEAGKIVDWKISWLPANSHWDKKREAHYKCKLAGHFKDQSGKWAVLKSDHSVEVFSTAGAARQYRRGKAKLELAKLLFSSLCMTFSMLFFTQIHRPSLSRVTAKKTMFLG